MASFIKPTTDLVFSFINKFLLCDSIVEILTPNLNAISLDVSSSPISPKTSFSLLLSIFHGFKFPVTKLSIAAVFIPHGLPWFYTMVYHDFAFMVYHDI
jgi:hypothetical protein